MGKRIEDKAFDPAVVADFRECIEGTALKTLTDDQCWEIYVYARGLYKAGKTRGVYSGITNKIIDWGICDRRKFLVTKTLVTKICVQFFGPLPGVKAGRPRKNDNRQKEVIEDLRQARRQLKQKFHPLMENIKLVDELWDEFKYWRDVARKSEEEKPYVLRVAKALADAIRDCTDLFKDLKLIEPSAPADNDRNIFIQSMQVAIGEHVQRPREFADMLEQLKGSIASLPECVAVTPGDTPTISPFPVDHDIPPDSNAS